MKFESSEGSGIKRMHLQSYKLTQGELASLWWLSIQEHNMSFFQFI